MAPPEPQAAGGSGGAPAEEEEESEEEALLALAQRLVSRVVELEAAPNPRLLHSLATLFEAQEARFVQECVSSSSFNNTRSSHTIGKLGNLVRENDEFYELVFVKFLSDATYSVGVRAATARLLISCSSAWMVKYPHVFEDAVLEHIKSWVMEDGGVSNGQCDWKHLGRDKPSDSEMLRTYAVGLLAIALVSGGQLVEDVLTLGVSARLMQFLRIRILGDGTSAQKDANIPLDTKHARGRDENRGKTRLVQESSRLEGTKVVDGILSDPALERVFDRAVGIRQAHGERWIDDGGTLPTEHADSSSEFVDMPEADMTNDRWHSLNIHDRSKYGERQTALKPVRDEDIDENSRDDLLRRRLNRTGSRNRGRGKTGESLPESERTPLSPNSGSRGSRTSRDKNVTRTDDPNKSVDVKKRSAVLEPYDLISKEEYEDRFRDCIIGLKDISDIVLKAVRAAEAEARAANAPPEAVKAAGDAAAELVKSAALEVWKSENNGDAVVLAANKAATTVVEAAMSTSVSRSSNQDNEERVEPEPVQSSEDRELEDFVIIDLEPLLQLREKYCIQCLQILGEYVEALGPILHEKGVDVCLALLQRSIKDQEGQNRLALLPEILKLICALAAHRKFAALFIDRGGIQKILSVPRITQTAVLVRISEEKTESLVGGSNFDHETYFGLSSCLFTIGSLQSSMERVCALSSDTVHKVVELALQLLECPYDPARKNAAFFFAAAFVFKAVLDSFDAQDGMQKVLNILHAAASVRSGGNPGGLGASNANPRNDQSPSEVLTTSEKQIAYHSCVALRQYFRAHLIQLVDSIRPSKSIRSIARNTSSARAGYKPFDISNEAMDAVFLQIQRDRKLGPALVRCRWLVVDKFLALNGHITMLELCQAPPVERYLHDLAQYAFGVLQIATLVPYSRKLIVNATLSNNRVGMTVFLDAANSVGYVDPEVIHPALNVLVNLVCPPPSISNKPSVGANQQPASTQACGMTSENRDRNAEKNALDRNHLSFNQSEPRERASEPNPTERGNAAYPCTPHQGNSSQTTTPVVPSGVVGDRRISLGVGAGGPGLAAQLEQGYRQAREAVRSNNGIKVLLHLLNPRMVTPPVAIDSIRALACRILLGLARDDAIAHILSKLQVGKKLSELIRDTGGQTPGGEQGRWQTELTQVAIELIAILTNSGKATTLAATDAAAPTLRRIERAAIAAATPISYHSRELMQLIHEHLQASGLSATAAMLVKEADLLPLPSMAAVPPLHQAAAQETSSVQLQWPSGRVPGFPQNKTKITQLDHAGPKSDSVFPSSKKKALTFSSSFSQRTQPSRWLSNSKASSGTKSPVSLGNVDSMTCSASNRNAGDVEASDKTPILLPLKRKLSDLKDVGSASAAKRPATADLVCQSPVFQTPAPTRRGLTVSVDSPTAFHSSRTNFNSIPVDNLDDACTPGGATTTSHLGATEQSGNLERTTLDSLVVQYLKHQHRQCPTPITTLPPLPLLHPHACPEPSRNLSAPANITARMESREIRREFSGIQIPRRDRQFIYSRFKLCRVCRDDATLLTCMTFLGDASRIATGNHSGELKIFDTNTANVLETQSCHQTNVTIVESASSGGNELILSSGLYEAKLWDALSISGGPLHMFEGCKAARFSHSGALFAALSTDTARREVLLYDVQTCNLDLQLPDNSNHSGSGRGHVQPIVHFSPSDTMLLWNGVLWDRRSPNTVHQFDQFTDYGGGGFHPAGNEVIINSEVWDLRKFKLLRSVPSLDQTVITFNGRGDVIYAILRRNLEDVTTAIHTRRVRHPLFPAFRTIDAVTYSEIATVQIDRCVLDLATEPNDSLVGVVAMDDHEEMFSSARLFEVGRKRPTDDDSDPEDGGDTEEEDDEDSEDSETDIVLTADLAGDGDTDSDDLSNDDEDDIDSGDDNDDDGEFIDDGDFDGGGGLLEIMGEGDGDGDDDGDESDAVESFSSGDEGAWIL